MSKLSELTAPEIEIILQKANFTKDEENVFMALTKGYTHEWAAEICNMSVSTVKRLKTKIWSKIERI